MKLPKHILEQIDWFEHYFQPLDNETHRDREMWHRFVLHFKPWWKPSKTLRVRGNPSGVVEGVMRWSHGNAGDELLAQLKAQCPDQA